MKVSTAIGMVLANTTKRIARDLNISGVQLKAIVAGDGGRLSVSEIRSETRSIQVILAAECNA